MKAKIFAAILLLAVSALWAAAPPPPDYLADTCGVTSFNQSSGNALSFIAVAFALVSTAIALAYMYSKAREDPAMGVWAKDEAFNLIISLFLFVAILAFFTGSCEVAQSYSGNANPITASQQYLDVLIQANGLNILKTLTADSINNQLDATKYIYMGISPFWGDGVAVKANRKSWSAHREYLIDMYTPIVASLTAQKYVLQGIAWMGAYVLLPFAFVLRLIPPTREFGNMLLALFFGIYIVVPTMYAMSGQIFMSNVQGANAPYTVSGLQMFHSYGLDNSQSPPADIKTTMLYRIGSTIPQAIFLPNLIIVVAVTCVMAMAKALRAIAV